MTTPNVLQTRLGQLDCMVVDVLPADAAPRLAAVLCHGFGAPGFDLVPLAAELLYLAPELAESVRFVFPAAPLSLDAQGMYGGRAWWMLDIAALNAAIARGEMRDQRQTLPDGLPEASTALADLVAELQKRDGLRADQLVLGGFSQGSMVTTDVALKMPDPPASLVVLSGTLLCEDAWRKLAAAQSSLRVLQSHGTADSILPYQGALWLRDMFVETGHNVDFVEFSGDHSIPPAALAKLAALLKAVASENA